jgi:hypothetical protein
LALVLPFLYVGCATYFAIFFVALRGKSGVEALKASLRLVKGRWWRTFRLLAAILCLEVLVVLVLAAPFTLFPESYIAGVVVGLISELAMSFFTVAQVLLFLALEPAPVPLPIDGVTAPVQPA